MKDRKNKTIKKILNYAIICAILSIMIWLGVEEYKDRKIKKEEIAKESQYKTQNISKVYNIEKETEKSQYPKEEIITEYKGYEVAAKLEIPAIKLETYILKNYSLNALNISVTKYWGADANEIGNFCIAGHNFQNQNMFRNLRNLEIGKRLTISDNNIGKIEYKIYDIYKVEPEDVSCLLQETDEKREVTLITCTTDSEQRIIVKAKEVK